jgi:hypothetical protein
MRVCGYYPLQATPPNLPENITWQDWVLTCGVFDNILGCFHRDGLPVNCKNNVEQQLQFQSKSSGDSVPFGAHTLELNENAIADILAATHAMPSWKDSQIEGTTWNGTAEENIQKYLSISQTP